MTGSRTAFHTWVSSSDCQVHVELAEDNEKPLLVLLHGFMMSRAIWMENIPALSKHFRCVSIELLGHGRSAAPEDPEPYYMSSYLRVINELRRDLNAASCLFCAHSFGASIALSFGLAHPDKTCGIVMTNSRSALGAIERNPDNIKHMKSKLRKQGDEALLALPWHPINMNEVRPTVQEALKTDARLLDPIGVSNTIEFTAEAASVFDRLSALSPPTLLINGRRERSFQSVRNDIAQRHPHIQIQDFDAGHSINAECPEDFNRKAISFLSDPSISNT